LIPKIIHQIWLGGPAPVEIADMMRSVRDHHPDWEYRLWTGENRPALINEREFLQAPSLAMKADFLRYELLHEYGGVYVDADFDCHRSLNPLMEGRRRLFVSEFGVVCNGLMGTQPQDEFMEILIRRAGQRFREADAGMREQPHLVTGPLLLDEAYVGFGLCVEDPNALLPGDYFFIPRTRVPAALSVAKPKRYMTHGGAASWRHRGRAESWMRSTKLRTRWRRFVDLTAQ
jgi:mannosyltransferase OCH1-like enzyme